MLMVTHDYIHSIESEKDTRHINCLVIKRTRTFNLLQAKTIQAYSLANILNHSSFHIVIGSISIYYFATFLTSYVGFCKSNEIDFDISTYGISK